MPTVVENPRKRRASSTSSSTLPSESSSSKRKRSSTAPPVIKRSNSMELDTPRGSWYMMWVRDALNMLKLMQWREVDGTTVCACCGVEKLKVDKKRHEELCGLENLIKRKVPANAFVGAEDTASMAESLLPAAIMTAGTAAAVRDKVKTEQLAEKMRGDIAGSYIEQNENENPFSFTAIPFSLSGTEDTMTDESDRQELEETNKKQTSSPINYLWHDQDTSSYTCEDYLTK